MNESKLIIFYFFNFRNLALKTTITILKDIKNAPIAGVINISRLNNNPTAIGIAKVLYPGAQIKF
ncbi:MAG: hypothetical protein ACFFBZ_12345 [Promethearchaeota archaeon]